MHKLKTIIGKRGFDFIRIVSREDAQKGASFLLDGTAMTSKEKFIAEIYRKIGQDEYIPYANLDGMDELLQPEFWPDTKAIHFTVINAEKLVENIDPKTLKAILLTLKYVAANWTKEKGKESFTLELVGDQ